MEQKFTKYNEKLHKCLLIGSIYVISCSWLILDSQKRLTRKRCSQHTVAVLCTRLQKWSSASLILGRSVTSGVLASFYTLYSQQPCLLMTATLQSLPHVWRKGNIQNHQEPQNVRYCKSKILIYFFLLNLKTVSNRKLKLTNICFWFSLVAKDLISRMLDPNPSSRATIQEILAHPWMKMTTSVKRQRKVNICYSKDNAENITKALVDFNRCDCSCHDEDVRANRRDSVITKHCPDCDDVIANDQQYLLRTVSTNSSGYGSEFGSQLDLDTPGILLQPGFYNRFMIRRNSTPKQSSSKPPLAHKQRNSIPSTTTKVYKDEDLVFV